MSLATSFCGFSDAKRVNETVKIPIQTQAGELLGQLIYEMESSADVQRALKGLLHCYQSFYPQKVPQSSKQFCHMNSG